MAISVEERTAVEPAWRVVVLGLFVLAVVWLSKKPASQPPPYSMHIEWSPEDGVFIVSLPEWGPYAKTHGSTYEEAMAAGREVLQMLIDNRNADKRSLPELPALQASQAA